MVGYVIKAVALGFVLYGFGISAKNGLRKAGALRRMHKEHAESLPQEAVLRREHSETLSTST